MANRTKLTPQKRQRFLKVLAATCNVTVAARDINVSRTQVYEARKRDVEFATAWDNAIEEGADALELDARRRALEGVKEPVFYKGEVCGHVRRYSTALEPEFGPVSIRSLRDLCDTQRGHVCPPSNGKRETAST